MLGSIAARAESRIRRDAIIGATEVPIACPKAR
jgi:hypothetical protein